MLEAVLMRAYLMLYQSNSQAQVYGSDDYVCGTDDDGLPFTYLRAEVRTRGLVQHRPFTVLSSVCWNWHQTLIGWPQSSTPAWLKRRLKKLIAREILVFNYTTFYSLGRPERAYVNNRAYKKLSYCWETVRRESVPRIAEMDVEVTT